MSSRIENLRQNPAVDALRRTVRLALGNVFGSFVRRLPDALRQQAQVLQTAGEQRVCAELAQAVIANSDAWLGGFLNRVDANLVGGVAAGKPAATSTNDDGLVVTRLELRAETLYAPLIADLDMRLDVVRRTVYFPVRTAALTPAGLCRALQDTARLLNCTGAHLRMLFDRFDEAVLPELPRVYQALLEALTAIEERAAEAAALLVRETARAEALRPPPPAPKPAPPVAAPAAAPQPAPRPQPTTLPLPATPGPGAPAVPPIDSKTVSMLQTVAAQPAAPENGYTDSALALELLSLQAGAPLPGVDIKPEQRQVPLQRISLAGQFLNEAIADPLVPDELGPQHESVRFPLVKSALSDATLFTALTHPLRSLVNELMLKSATSRITGTAESRRMAEVLQQVLVQFDLAPDFVREAMLTAQPISEEQIRSFFELQKQQAVQRKDAVVVEAKRLVVRELELRTFGRSVSPPGLKYLNTCWGPLLVRILLKYGADHAHWRAGIDRMETMLDELELSDQQMPSPPSWQDLCTAMCKNLADAGLSSERLKEAEALLEAAWKAPNPKFPF